MLLCLVQVLLPTFAARAQTSQISLKQSAATGRQQCSVVDLGILRTYSRSPSSSSRSIQLASPAPMTGCAKWGSHSTWQGPRETPLPSHMGLKLTVPTRDMPPMSRRLPRPATQPQGGKTDREH